LKRRSSNPDAVRLDLLVTVTFNPNQLRAHLLPLIELPEVERITLVADRLPPPLPKLRPVVPHALLTRLLGRAAAKFLVCLWIALRERPDWVIGFNFVPHGFNARIVAALVRSRSLYHMIGGEREWIGGGWTSENGVLGRLPRPVPPLERLIVRLIGGCTAVVTMGERGRASLIERGVEPSRVRAIPPATDTTRFHPSTDDHCRWDVITVARLTPDKRIVDLLKAVALLRADGCAASVAIVGDGPLQAELRREAERLGVAGSATFLGFREDVEELYRQSKIFALTSVSEGMPIAMLDAMSCGLPVVATDVGEIASVVEPGVSGYLVRCGDVPSLAERLAGLLRDDDLRARLGAAAAERIRSDMSVDAVASLYRGILTPAGAKSAEDSAPAPVAQRGKA
jgi:glycosyltransferase involved in cell wall biosynthesis